MSPGDLGLLLQGIGSCLLAAVTALIGLRASNVLKVRVEGPLAWERRRVRATRR